MDAGWGANIYQNTTGETIPPGALLEPTGSLTADGLLIVQKPTRNSSLGLLVNDLLETLPGQYGQYRPPSPQVTLAVHADDTLTAADTLGSKSGDWYARKGYAGFRPVGAAYSGFVAAIPDVGGSSAAPQLVVKPVAAGAGDGTYADALVMVQSGDGWVDGTEHVQFKPRTLGQKQKVNLLWWSCWDTGLADSGFTPARRKIIGVDPPMVKRRLLALCDGSTPKYVDQWMPDVD